MQRFEEGIIIPYKICTCYMHMGGKWDVQCSYDMSGSIDYIIL